MYIIIYICIYSLNIVISKIEELFTTVLAGFRTELTCLMFLGCAKKDFLHHAGAITIGQLRLVDSPLCLV